MLVAERDGVLNPQGYDLHHCFFHSELDYGVTKEELEQLWNYQAVPRVYHEAIHNPENDTIAKLGHSKELFYKKLALSRYQGKFRKQLEKILKKKSIHYGIL